MMIDGILRDKKKRQVLLVYMLTEQNLKYLPRPLTLMLIKVEEQLRKERKLK
jgi:hypothetical protein